MRNNINGKLTVSVEEASRMLGISRGLGYRLASTGELPVLRLGQKRMLVPKIALEKMLAGNRLNDAT